MVKETAKEYSARIRTANPGDTMYEIIALMTEQNIFTVEETSKLLHDGYAQIKGLNNEIVTITDMRVFAAKFT